MRERFEGARKPIWEGVVETFQLDGHPTAKRAYAWETPAEVTREKPEPEYTVVLGLPPVNSPEDAGQGRNRRLRKATTSKVPRDCGCKK